MGNIPYRRAFVLHHETFDARPIERCYHFTFQERKSLCQHVTSCALLNSVFPNLVPRVFSFFEGGRDSTLGTRLCFSRLCATSVLTGYGMGSSVIFVMAASMWSEFLKSLSLSYKGKRVYKNALLCDANLNDTHRKLPNVTTSRKRRSRETNEPNPSSPLGKL